MQLPWKKKMSGSSSSGGGGGRFSRLVTDLQQPLRRGGSLVVQSDFPASIIDLFVKNKDRVKKTAKSRRKRGKQQRQQVSGGVAPSENFPASEEANRRDFLLQAPISSPEEERADSGPIEPSEESDIPDLDGASRSRFLEVAVAVTLGLLALFTKSLVIFATIVALSLSFLEFVGACDCFRPSRGKTVTIEASGPAIGVSRSLEPDSDHQIDSGKSDSSKSEPESEEIKVRESNSETAVAVEDNSASNAEEDDAVVGDSCENQDLSRRRRKLKSKIIKRVVPKKIRSHMKELGHELHRR